MSVTVWSLRSIQTLSNLVAEIVQCGVVGDEGHVDGAAEEQELGRHLVKDLPCQTSEPGIDLRRVREKLKLTRLR